MPRDEEAIENAKVCGIMGDKLKKSNVSHRSRPPQSTVGSAPAS